MCAGLRRPRHRAMLTRKGGDAAAAASGATSGRRISARAAAKAKSLAADTKKSKAKGAKTRNKTGRKNADAECGDSIGSLLEEENKKLRSEIQTLSMLKAASIREQHQLEQRVNMLQRRVKGLEDELTHMRLEEERRHDGDEGEEGGEDAEEERNVLGNVSVNVAKKNNKGGKRRRSARMRSKLKHAFSPSGAGGSSVDEDSEDGMEEEQRRGYVDEREEDEDDVTGPLDHEVLNNSRESHGSSRGLGAGARRVTHAKQKSGIRAAAKRVARVNAGEVGGTGMGRASAGEGEDNISECATQ